MTNTVLVLGATGMIGRRLVPLLRDRGVTVRAASRTASDGHTLFDWRDPATQVAALAGVRALYLVPPPLVEDPTSLVAPLLRAAKEAGVERVVAVTSLGVDFPGEPASSGRRELERLVKGSGLEWTLLRPGGFAQNFSEGFLRPGIDRAMVVSATGPGEVAMIDAGDIAAVAALALTEPGHAGQTYELTGAERLSFGDAVATIGRITGREIAYRTIEPAEMEAMLRGFGLPAEYAAVVVRDQVAIRDGAGARITDTVERLTGKRPTSFAAVAERVAW